MSQSYLFFRIFAPLVHDSILRVGNQIVSVYAHSRIHQNEVVNSKLPIPFSIPLYYYTEQDGYMAILKQSNRGQSRSTIMYLFFFCRGPYAISVKRGFVMAGSASAHMPVSVLLLMLSVLSVREVSGITVSSSLALGISVCFIAFVKAPQMLSDLHCIQKLCHCWLPHK